MSSDLSFFELAESEVLGAAVLHVDGEIDVASAPAFQASLLGLSGRSSEKLIVDLNHVSFMDSTGLGVLVAVERDARAAGKHLCVEVARPQIAKLFELTGLDKVFTVLSNTDSGRP